MLKQRPVRHCFHIRSLCRSRAHVTMNISAYSSAAAAQQNMVQQLVGRARTWAGKPDNAAGLQSLSAVLSEATGMYGLHVWWIALSHSNVAGDLPIQQLGFQDPVSAQAYLHANLCLFSPAVEPLMPQLQAQGAASPKEGFLSKLWRPEEHRCDSRQCHQACHSLLCPCFLYYVNLLRCSITYIHIYEDPTVSIGIFCLPKGAQLPLHNHPGMTVLSR